MSTLAKQIDFLLAGMQDATGLPLSGAIVVTRNSANSAAKAVWEDRDKTLPSVAGKSQFNLNTDGMAEVFGDGVYTIIIYAAADTGLTSPLHTFDGVSYSEEDAFVDDGLVVAEDLAELQAIDTTTPPDYVVYLRGTDVVGDGGEGSFIFDSSDLSAQVTEDTDFEIYVATATDPTGASGAFVRENGTYYLVCSGQSNAIGSGVVGVWNTDISPFVKVWNDVTAQYETPVFGQHPLNTSGANNPGIQAADRIARTQRKRVKVIINAEGGQSLGTFAQTPIAAITNASPCQITLEDATDNLLAGDDLEFYDIEGTVELNGNTYEIVTVIDDNNFTINVNSTAFGLHVANTGGMIRTTDGQNISLWTDLNDKITGAAFPKIDGMIWLQGEKDSVTTVTGFNTQALYLAGLVQFWSQLETLDEWNDMSNFVSFSLGEWIENQGAVSRNDVLQGLRANERRWVTNISAVGCDTDGEVGNNAHYSGASTDIIGERFAGALLAMPKTNEPISTDYLGLETMRAFGEHPSYFDEVSAIDLDPVNIKGGAFITARNSTLNLPLASTVPGSFLVINVTSRSGGNVIIDSTPQPMQVFGQDQLTFECDAVGMYVFLAGSRWQLQTKPYNGEVAENIDDNANYTLYVDKLLKRTYGAHNSTIHIPPAALCGGFELVIHAWSVTNGPTIIDSHNKALAITQAFNENPCRITLPTATSLATGDKVFMDDLTGMTELNGNTYTITVAGDNLSFTLDGVDATAFGVHPGGDGTYAQVIIAGFVTAAATTADSIQLTLFKQTVKLVSVRSVWIPYYSFV